MARGYGQYCPLALAAELLAERWTILVISRLIDGCSHFNAIHRGVPRISPSLLSKRLTELERAGIVEKSKKAGEPHATYRLTPAGRDLEPLVDQMAVWGQQWARDLAHEDLDPAFLAWSMHSRMNTAALPNGRVVIEFEFDNVPGSLNRFWILSEDRVIEMCLQHPGYDSDLRVRADLRGFVETWRGFRDLRTELRSRRIQLIGPPSLKKQFPNWLLLSGLAPIERRRAGKERTLTRRANKSRSTRRAIDK